MERKNVKKIVLYKFRLLNMVQGKIKKAVPQTLKGQPDCSYE